MISIPIVLHLIYTLKIKIMLFLFFLIWKVLGAGASSNFMDPNQNNCGPESITHKWVQIRVRL